MDPTIFSEVEDEGDKEEGIWRVNAGGEMVAAYWIVLDGACADVARNIAGQSAIPSSRLVVRIPRSQRC